jgi:AsmA protein
MTPRRVHWKWLLLGAAALLIIGIAILPRYLVDSSRLADRVAEAISAWSGGEVRLTGPVRVSYFPDITIKSGFELTNASRLPLVKSITAEHAKVSLGLAALVFGHIRVDALRMSAPEITLKDVPSLVMGPDQTLQARVVNLLGGAPIGVIRLRDGTIHIPTQAGSETIRKIDARFDASAGDGSVSSLGSFVLRDETVRFSLNCGAPAQIEADLRIPVALTFTSSPLAAKVAGTASFANGLQIDGDVKADIPSARALLNWAGIALPAGQSLQELAASGPAHWNGTTLTFDDGTFTLDGNTAVGLLALTPGERPRIEGTLAFDRLALDPYWGDRATAEPAGAEVALAEGAVFKHVDADLRISAGEIAAPRLKLGRGAFTISAKGGVMASEVGELELCGGQASGRFGLDVSQGAARASVAADVSEMPLEPCLTALQFDIPLTGIGDLKAEAGAEGRTFGDLIQRLAGSFTVNARNGAVPVDFGRLLGAAAPLDADGWSRDSVTVFDQLKADCRLGSGHIWCDTFNMQTRRGVISGSGDVDLGQRTLDWSLFVATPAQPLRASQLSAETPPRVSISGSLLQPMIRRADRPTLGDGSVQANPAVNQISPR